MLLIPGICTLLSRKEENNIATAWRNEVQLIHKKCHGICHQLIGSTAYTKWKILHCLRFFFLAKRYFQSFCTQEQKLVFLEHLCFHTLLGCVLPYYHLFSSDNLCLELRIVECNILILREAIKTEVYLLWGKAACMSSVYALLWLAKQFCLYISQSMAISWARVISVLFFLLQTYGQC